MQRVSLTRKFLCVVVVVVAGVWSAAVQLMLGWAEFVQQWELQFPAWPPAYSQQLQEVLGTYTASLMGAAMAAARADADAYEPRVQHVVCVFMENRLFRIGVRERLPVWPVRAGLRALCRSPHQRACCPHSSLSVVCACARVRVRGMVVFRPSVGEC